jgi:hypothetical protein
MTIIREVAHGLSELESGFGDVRDLTMAIVMMSANLSNEEGSALSAVAYAIKEKVAALIEERERLWRLALRIEKEETKLAAVA